MLKCSATWGGWPSNKILEEYQGEYVLKRTEKSRTTSDQAKTREW